MMRFEKPSWPRVALLLGLWAFVGTILSVEIFFNLRVLEQRIDFYDVAWPQYLRAAVWVVLAPIVCWLARRIPVGSGRYGGGVAFHVFSSVVLMAAYYLARLTYVMLSKGEAWSEFWAVAERNFYGRNLIDIAYYWVIVGGVYVYDLRRRFRETELSAAQLGARLVEAELQTLKSQLHPHFLFNTMNTISVLVREGRNADAVVLLSKLSTLLRQSLDQTRSLEVPLRQELEFVDNYVQIQQARFSDRLSFACEVPEELLGRPVPALLLQPLVENAILYGVSAKEGPGRVRVSARVEGGSLVLEVSDDGPGFPPQERATRRREGIGLGNTRERLARMYGERAKLEITSTPGQGSSVSVRLPFSP